MDLMSCVSVFCCDMNCLSRKLAIYWVDEVDRDRCILFWLSIECVFVLNLTKEGEFGRIYIF